MTRLVRIELAKHGLFDVRASVVDVETGVVLAFSDQPDEVSACADARLMICENEREVSS